MAPHRIVGSCALLALAALALTGCSAADASRGAAVSEPSPPPTSTSVALVGEWAAAGPAIDPGTRLRFGASDLEIVAPCGSANGTWVSAGNGATLLKIGGHSKHCSVGAGGDPMVEPAWSVSVRSVVPSATGADLLDANGGVVAALTQVQAGTPSPPAPPFVRPVLDAVPATTDRLVGLWVTSDGRKLDLRATGEAAVGLCGTELEGRWALLAEDSILMYAGPGVIPAVACDEGPLGIDVGPSLRSVGFRGDTLVIAQPDGTEVVLTPATK